MISQQTIEAVHNLSLEEVIREEITLKAKGANYTACCPFHEEKTPSFSVSTHKQVYKCFGCGAGGNSGVSFVMEYHKMSYPEAIIYLAEKYGIAITYTKDDTQKVPTEDEKALRKKAELYLIAAQRKFTKDLSQNKELAAYFKQREISEEAVSHFELGWAAGSNFIKNAASKNGDLPAAMTCGLVKHSEKADQIKYYDAFQDRLMFPIHSPQGRLLGFGGRVIAESKYAKYINTGDTFLYKKDKTIYNLHRAIRPIRNNRGIAYLMEGYMDVVSVHRIGLPNAVAGCGTAFTANQAKLLERYATTVVLWYDGDSAGRAATMKAAKLLLELKLKVKVISVLGKDPDDYAKSAKQAPRAQHFLDWAYAQIHAPLTDYIFPKNKKTEALEEIFRNADKDAKRIDKPEEIYYTSYQPLGDLVPEKVKYTINENDLDDDELDEQRQKFLALLKLYPDSMQDTWIDKLSKSVRSKGWGVAKSTLSKWLKGIESENLTERSDIIYMDDDDKIPQDCDTDFYKRHWFAPKNDNSGYYFMYNGSYISACNCVIKPLFHVQGSENNQRYIQVLKGNSSVNVLVDSRAMVSQASLEQALVNEGPFFISDLSKQLFNRLVAHMIDQFPKCYELAQLGYQQEGFIAYANMVYNGKLTEYNELGIFRHEKKNYLSPVIVEELKDRRGGDTALEKDKYFSYRAGSSSIEEYFQSFYDVFGSHAPYGIAFKIITLFRDICRRKAHIPFLYAYGAKEAGKSVFQERILHFFFCGKDNLGEMMPGTNLDNVSDFALAATLQRFQNCPALLNELEERTLDEKRMQAIKGTFDGIGRQKGSKEGNIITQTPTCTLLLAGQFLFTKDDNSVVSRAVIRSFPVKNYTIEDRNRLQQLDDMIDEGTSHLLCEIYKHRDYFSNKYDSTYISVHKRLKEEFKKRKVKMSSRLVDNNSHFLASLTVMSKHIQLPFSLSDFYEQMVQDMMEQNGIMKSSDSVSEFWNFVCYMLNNRIIQRDNEIKIESVVYVDVLGKNDMIERVTFESPKEIIYLNMKQLHSAYAQNKRNASMTISNLKKYLSEMDGFIGPCKKTTFSKGAGTSAYMFYADELPDVAAQLHASKGYQQELQEAAERKAKQMKVEEEDNEFMEQVGGETPF